MSKKVVDHYHYRSPSLKRAHVLILYVNWKKRCHSHIGLGVNAMHTVRVLRRNRVLADSAGVNTPKDVAEAVHAFPTATHVIIEAPWLTGEAMGNLVCDFPATHFVVRTHSQLGFLQADRRAFTNLRDGLKLQEEFCNLSMAGNNEHLCRFIEGGYRCKMLYLPNLYFLERASTKHFSTPSRILRAASYGALRPGKNHYTAAGASLMMARMLDRDLEFHFNTNRDHVTIGQGLHEMLDYLPGVKVVEDPWSDWPSFRHKASHVDVVFALSHTESFCLTAADAVAEGTPAVTSNQVEWIPSHYRVQNSDVAEEAARIGMHALSSRHAAMEQRRALESYIARGLEIWLKYLGNQPT